MSGPDDFADEVRQNICRIGEDREFLGLSRVWIREAIRNRYAHNFSWLGRPIMQVPQDTYAIQEILWKVRPDLVIETGVAHGGSLVLSASLLALLDYCDAARAGERIEPRASGRRVIGVDIEIRSHNRRAIESHPMAHLIELVEGSSVEPGIVAEIRARARAYQRTVVFLDSNHTHDHVLAELEAYAPLTSLGSYCVVWDTGVENLPPQFYEDRPWGKGNNPKTAAREYLRRLSDPGRAGTDGLPLHFEVDALIENKLVITASPEGFLRRIP